jgi:hypothetical protein
LGEAVGEFDPAVFEKVVDVSLGEYWVGGGGHCGGFGYQACSRVQID